MVTVPDTGAPPRTPSFDVAPHHRAALRSAAVAARASTSLVAGPIRLALEQLEHDAPARPMLELAARYCERLLSDIERLEGAARGRPPSIAIDLRVDGARVGRRVSRPNTPGALTRVLIVDPNPEHRLFVRHCLGEFAQCIEVASAVDALEQLHAHEFDVLITEVGLPTADGVDLPLAVRTIASLYAVRIVVLTARSERRLRDELLSEVVDDYLVQPIDPSELQARTMRLGRDAAALRELHLSARRDALTGLPNRKALLEALQRLQTAAHHGAPAIAMLLDIDHFKRVNDTYGHNVGDEVLREFALRAHAIAQELVPGVVVGRFGGEEFLALGTGSQEVGCQLAVRILAAIRSRPFIASIGPIAVTCSAGLAAWTEADLLWTNWIERADVALYQAKRRGRDRACFADRDIQDAN